MRSIALSAARLAIWKGHQSFPILNLLQMLALVAQQALVGRMISSFRSCSWPGRTQMVCQKLVQPAKPQARMYQAIIPVAARMVILCTNQKCAIWKQRYPLQIRYLRRQQDLMHTDELSPQQSVPSVAYQNQQVSHRNE